MRDNKQEYGEPWEIFGKHGGMTAIASSNDWANASYLIAECEGPNRDKNAERIILCVNACAGMSGEDLEAVTKIGNVGRMIDLAADLIKKHETEIAALTEAGIEASNCFLAEVGRNEVLSKQLADTKSKLKIAAEMATVLFNGGTPARELKKSSMAILKELNSQDATQ